MSETQYFMIPGPTQVPPSVLRAGGKPMINHRGAEFCAMLTELTDNLKQIFRTKNDLFTFTASGSGGLEASVTNFLNPGDKVLLASIGNFGDRYRDICRQFGIDLELLEFEWGKPVDPEIIRAKLAEDRDQQIKAVLCQHNETSTGVYNDIKAISEARGGHSALLFIDSVSGLAAVPLETDAWGVDVVVAASQKALMSPPGLAFMSVSERAWKLAENCRNACFYFSVKSAKSFLLKGQTPFTPAVSIVYGVLEASRIILGEGLDNYITEHFLRRDLVRTGIRAMGLKCLAEDDYASPAVTTILLPEGIKPQEITAPLKEKLNMVVAGGMGKLKDNTFRIGHVGYLNLMDIVATLSGVEMALLKAGADITPGKAAAAAQAFILEKVWDR